MFRNARKFLALGALGLALEIGLACSSSPAAPAAGGLAGSAATPTGMSGVATAGTSASPGNGVASGAAQAADAGAPLDASSQPPDAGRIAAPPAAVAGAPGSVPPAAAGQAGAGGAAAPAPVAGSEAQPSAGPFTLIPTNFRMGGPMGGLSFPAAAVSPMDVSPGFSWTGAPKDTKSFTLVFEDPDISAVKWVLWDIPGSATMIPEGISDAANMPSEVPGSSQLGSLGNIGYAGPVRTGQVYRFTLFALDVDKLPDAQGKETPALLADAKSHEIESVSLTVTNSP